MALYRCQAVFAHNNGRPEDSVSNTFHIKTAGAPTGVEAELVAENVRDFYVEAHAPAVVTLGSYFSRAIAGGGHQVRVYPVDEATGNDTRGEGFPPLHVEGFDLVGRTLPGESEPAEVSVCLSYRNDVDLNTPPARRRGRLYFGPLKRENVVSTDSLTGRAYPNGNLLEALRAAGEWLIEATAPGDWGIYSRPYAGRGANEEFRANGTPLPAIPARPGSFLPATSVWTDDAFDTQRRRGERAVSRIFGA